MKHQTWVILDGMDDPNLGQALSRAWMQAGFANAVDVAGQCGWLARRADDRALTEAEVDEAALVARQFGLEIRERAGKTFRPDNDLQALRGQLQYEYKSRFATALVFGLPAFGLHLLSPLLAGGANDARGMLYPWLFELLLVGWLCLAAGWPILWQGVLAMRHLRLTGDALVTLTVALSLLPSAVGVLAMPIARTTFLEPGVAPPLFHAAGLVMTWTVLGRWLLHRQAGRLAGRANLMLRGFGRLIFLWLVLALAAGWLGYWALGVAVLMLLPPLLPLGAINPWNPGPGVLLPAAAFAVFMLLGPRSLDLPIRGVEVYVAAGFGLMMMAAFSLGWRHIKPAG